MHSKTVDAFEARVDKCLDAFPFESRAAAKKYLYLLDLGYEGQRADNCQALRIVRGNSKGFIDWHGTVVWGGRE